MPAKILLNIPTGRTPPLCLTSPRRKARFQNLVRQLWEGKGEGLGKCHRSVTMGTQTPTMMIHRGSLLLLFQSQPYQGREGGLENKSVRMTLQIQTMIERARPTLNWLEMGERRRQGGQRKPRDLMRDSLQQTPFFAQTADKSSTGTLKKGVILGKSHQSNNNCLKYIIWQVQDPYDASSNRGFQL